MTPRPLILCLAIFLTACSDDDPAPASRDNLNFDFGRRDASMNTSPPVGGTTGGGTTTPPPVRDMGLAPDMPPDMAPLADASAGLVTRMTPEPVGTNCPRGGTKIEQGPDTDQDGILDDNEVQADLTRYQCDAQCTEDSFFHTGRMQCVPRPRLAAGSDHTCASFDGQPLRCWGANDSGQLGTGTNADSGAPVRTANIAPGLVRALDAYADHTCAIDATGAVQCWGINLSGQLGRGSTRFGPKPERALIGMPNAATALATGSNHTCAMTTMRGAQCWGRNTRGQLGEDSGRDNTLPVATMNLNEGVFGLAAGANHTCAVTRARRIRCWGDNAQGQTAQPGAQQTPTPFELPGLASIDQLAAGATHTCALAGSGTLSCWGTSSSGQLGRGSVTGAPAAPAQVTFPQNLALRAIAAGAAHTCALTAQDGRLFCWGANDAGQLGIGTNLDQSTPREVTGIAEEVVAITAGAAHTCAALASGQMRCWGANSSGQLGTGMNQDANVPTNVLGL